MGHHDRQSEVATRLIDAARSYDGDLSRGTRAGRSE